MERTTHRKLGGSIHMGEHPSTGDSWASTPTVRKIMQGNKSRDTAPELAVRRLLHASGYRFRVDYPLPGLARRRADVAFTRVRLAVFIDGCFWHGCPRHFVQPRSNPEYWLAKISTNVARDKSTNSHLSASGWAVLRYWSHEDPQAIVRDVTSCVDRLRLDGSDARLELPGPPHPDGHVAREEIEWPITVGQSCEDPRSTRATDSLEEGFDHND